MKSPFFQRQGYFFFGVLLVFIAIVVFLPQKGSAAFSIVVDLLKKLAPLFVLIFVLMTVVNYYITPKRIARLLGSSGVSLKAWVVAIVGGVLSSGPIYMWYPLLRDLRKKGVTNGLIATFLYARAIKLPLLPLLILYFGFSYSVVLILVMLVMAVIQGLLVQKSLDSLETF